MAIEYLKKASKKHTTGEDQTRETASRILKEKEDNGEKKPVNMESNWMVGKEKSTFQEKRLKYLQIKFLNNLRMI